MLVFFKCFDGRDGQESVHDHGSRVIDQQQLGDAPGINRQLLRGTVVKRRVIVMIRRMRRTQFLVVFRVEGEAVQAEGEQRPQQAEQVTAGAATEQQSARVPLIGHGEGSSCHDQDSQDERQDEELWQIVVSVHHRGRQQDLEQPQQDGHHRCTFRIKPGDETM